MKFRKFDSINIKNNNLVVEEMEMACNNSSLACQVVKLANAKNSRQLDMIYATDNNST